MKQRMKTVVKLILVITGLTLVTPGLAQREINNKKTSLHQQVAGSRFFLVPPANFVAATGFQGFHEPETGSSILVMDIPGAFAENTKGFTEPGLKPQGVNLQKREEIKVNGDQGLFLIADQAAEGTTFLKYILVFGDLKSTHMINGTFPRSVSLYHKDIIESMLSVVYDSSLAVDPLDAIPFFINTSDTKFKLAHNLSGTVMFTVDGKVPPEVGDKTMLMVGSSAESVIINRRQTALERIHQLPYSDLKVDQAKIASVTMDGISGYEITGEGTSTTGVHEFIYQVMLFSETDYYIIVGIMNEDFPGNLALFRKVAASFKRK
jgi:hypothetical protein